MSLIVKEPEKKKPTPWAAYTWVKEADVCRLTLGKNQFALWEESGVWITTATIKGKNYRAERTTMEDAAKAIYALIAKNFPKVWTTIDFGVIINPWKASLEFDEN